MVSSQDHVPLRGTPAPATLSLQQSLCVESLGSELPTSAAKLHCQRKANNLLETQVPKHYFTSRFLIQPWRVCLVIELIRKARSFWYSNLVRGLIALAVYKSHISCYIARIQDIAKRTRPKLHHLTK